MNVLRMYLVAFELVRRWSVQINSDASAHTYLASLMLSSVLFMNAVTLIILADMHLSLKFGSWIGGVIVISFALINNWFFSRPNYQSLSENPRIRGFVERKYKIVPIYAALSLLTLVLAGFAKL